MKNLIFIIALAGVLSSCSKTEIVKPMDTQVSINTDGGKTARYPGVGAALITRLTEDVCIDHPACLTDDLYDMACRYLNGCGEYTPNEAVVGMSFSHSDDILYITFNEVTYKFYKDGTTDWQQDEWPQALSAQAQPSQQAPPIK